MDATKNALEQIKKDRLAFPTDAAALLFGLLIFSVAIFALRREFLSDPDTYWPSLLTGLVVTFVPADDGYGVYAPTPEMFGSFGGTAGMRRHEILTSLRGPAPVLEFGQTQGIVVFPSFHAGHHHDLRRARPPICLCPGMHPQCGRDCRNFARRRSPPGRSHRRCAGRGVNDRRRQACGPRRCQTRAYRVR
jgi:hypothetical protein